ncbi:M15 family metallopeptidase [Micromonospora sp. M12]
MILLSDPRVAAVTSADDGDPLLDLRDVPELRLDGRAADPAGVRPAARRGRRPPAGRAAALPAGMRLLVVEGYRPYQAQLAIFTGYRDELRRRYPGWSPERLHRETTKFVSPVEVAPHSTGGAVDLTLCTEDGMEVDLGTAIDATPEDSADACFTDAPTIGATARRHRQIMVDALGGAGW